MPGGKTYFVNVAVADTGTPAGTIYRCSRSAAARSRSRCSTRSPSRAAARRSNAATFTGGATDESTLTAAGGKLTGGYFKDPVTNIVYTCVVDAGATTFIDSNNTVYPYPAPAPRRTSSSPRWW